MKIEKICLCSGAEFFGRLKSIKEDLESLGYTVLMPNVDTVSEEKRGELIREHFGKIEQSDGILVCNYHKGNTEGYIGGSVLMEMAKAFDKNLPIFLINSVPKMDYRSEIAAMKPMVINRLTDIKEYAR